MTDLQEWFIDPSNPRELDEALKLPSVKKALSIISLGAVPSGFTTGDPATKVTQAAHNWHYYAGFHDAIKMLRSLARDVTPEEAPLEPFDPEWLIEWSKQRQQSNPTQ